MATEEDLKKAEDASEDEAEAAEAEQAATEEIRAKEEAHEEPSTDDDVEEGVDVPVQLGYQRYVYAAYMAAAMLAGFLAAKIGHAGWYRLGQWKPELGEPKDELI